MSRGTENHQEAGVAAENGPPALPGNEVPASDVQRDIRQSRSGKHQRLGHTQADIAAERFFWSILNQSPDAIFIYDVGTERIVDVNSTACESLGYEREELLGKTPRDFDPNVMRDPGFLLRVNERLLRGETFSFETLHRRKDGVDFPVEVRVRRFRHEDRDIVIAQVRDITERRAAEQEHRVYVHFLEALERVDRVVQTADDLRKMVDEVLGVMVEVFGCDVAVLGSVSAESGSDCFTVEGSRDRQGPGTRIAVGSRYAAAGELRELFRTLEETGVPMQFSSTSPPLLPPGLRESIGLQSVLLICSNRGFDQNSHFLILGQWSHQRIWTEDEMSLFRDVGLRLGDGIGKLLLLRTLRLSEARLKEAERLAHVGWWERDLLTNRVYLSDELCRMFGVEQEDVATWRQQHWLRLIHPEDRQRAVGTVAIALRGTDRYDLDYRLVRTDGIVRTVHSHGEVKRDALGKPIRLFGILQDVTELKRAEEALSASEARFRTFVDHATDSFFLHDEQMTVIDVNQYACETHGYRREEMIGMHPRDWDIGLDAASIAGISARLDAGGPVTFETVHRRKDGTRFPVEVRLRRFQLGGRILRFSLVRDITERKQGERRLRAQHAVTEVLSNTRSVEEAAPKILQAICESLDWDCGTLWSVEPRADVLRCMHYYHRPGLAFPAFEVATRALTFQRGVGLPGRVWESRAAVWIPDVVHDGTFLRAEAARREGLHAAFAFPILLGGEVLGIIDFLSRNVREREPGFLDLMATIGNQIGQFIERQRAESALQLVQAELAHVMRVTTMGELTASIAHEVNQPLGAMVTSAAAGSRWLRAEPPQIERALRALERIVADGTRAGQVIGRVRSLLKRQAPQMDWLDLSETIRETMALSRDQAWRHNVAMNAHLAEACAPIWGDRVQLQQVFLNLIVNAIEAMADIEDRPRVLTIVTQSDDADTLQIEFHDTGSGVDPARAEQVFETFYTTKLEGIGMGLAISRSIVETHGGRLWVRPNEPQGAVFLISLPRKGPSP